MDQWLVALLSQLMKVSQGNGSHETMRAVIQDEIRKSQNQENNEVMKQILATLDQKHAAQLKEANHEKEKYKLEAEFLRGKLQEIDREKRSAERSEKMKNLASHLAGLSLHQNQYPPPYHTHKKQNSYVPRPSTSQDNYSGGPLPWLDPGKGNIQSAPRGGKHFGRGYQQRNFTNSQSKKGFQSNHHSQQKTHFQQSQHMQQDSYYQQSQSVQQNIPFYQNPNVQQMAHSDQNSFFQQNPHVQQNTHFQQNPHVPQNTHLKQNTRFQQNPHVPQNTHLKQNTHFQQNTNFQQNMHVQQNTHFQQNTNLQQNTHYLQNPSIGREQNFQQSGGQHPPRYRGKGQRGDGRGRGRGRSVSVGRNTMKSEVQHRNQISDTAQALHTYGAQQWVSTENINLQADVPSRQGRVPPRGRGRGRGGQGNAQQEISGSQQPMLKKKNRNKYPKNEETEPQHQRGPRNKQENDQGDPEDNCVIS